MGSFAELLLNHVFTKEELTSIAKDKLMKEERYQLLKFGR